MPIDYSRIHKDQISYRKKLTQIRNKLSKRNFIKNCLLRNKPDQMEKLPYFEQED